MITKDGKDTPILGLTPENYIVPKGEERSYHAVIEIVQFDPKTGKRISKPRVQKFGKKMFESHILASLRKQGYSITILHNPNQWIEAEKARKAESAKAAAAAKAKAEQERFDAAVAAAVEKALTERAVAERAAEVAAIEKAAAEAAGAAEADNKAETEQPAKKPGRPAKTE